MEKEFDPVEGKLVEGGIPRRDVVPLIVSGAFAVCGCMAMLLWLSHPSLVWLILFLVAPVLIWSSVVIVYRVTRNSLKIMLPFAILVSLIWVFILLFAHQPGV